MIYFDTAYILKCYIHEPGTPEVRSLLLQHRSAASCAIGRLEFAAGVKRAIREGRIDPRTLNTIFAIFEEDYQNGIWSWLPVTTHLIDAAVRAVHSLPSSTFLRSADAMHIVCAREAGFSEIYSNDRHLTSAAPHFGIRATNIIV